MKNYIVIIVTLVVSSQACAYITNFNGVFFTNKKNIFTAKDNCHMWVQKNPGVEDIYFSSRQDSSQGNYKNTFLAHLNRYMLEDDVLNLESCESGTCDFSLNGIPYMQSRRHAARLRDNNQQFTLRGYLENNTITIDAVYLTDENGREYINCYR